MRTLLWQSEGIMRQQIETAFDYDGEDFMFYETNEYLLIQPRSLVCYHAAIAHATAMPMEAISVEPIAPVSGQLDRLRFKGARKQ